MIAITFIRDTDRTRLILVFETDDESEAAVRASRLQPTGFRHAATCRVDDDRQMRIPSDGDDYGDDNPDPQHPQFHPIDIEGGTVKRAVDRIAKLGSHRIHSGQFEAMQTSGGTDQTAIIGHPPEQRGFRGPGAGVARAATARIEAFVTVDSGTQRETVIGEEAWLMKHVHIGHDAVVGRGAELAPGVVVGGFAEIHQFAKIGVNATILPFRIVGANAVIGAGAVVTKDVPPGTTWVGNPARELDDEERDPRVHSDRGDQIWVGFGKADDFIRTGPPGVVIGDLPGITDRVVTNESDTRLLPGAFSNVTDKDIPVRLGTDGPIVGTAQVHEDEIGVWVEHRPHSGRRQQDDIQSMVERREAEQVRNQVERG